MSSWRRRPRDFSGFSAASFVATLLDGLLYLALLETLVDQGVLGVGVAAACGAVFGGLVHYALSRFWVFRRFRASLWRSAATYFAMSWLAAAIHGVATDALARLVDPRLAWFLSKALLWIFWTYPLSRWVVFGGIGARSGADPTNSERS